MISAKFWPLVLTALITTLPLTKALNILLTNDDSWASPNIRATYDALKADGHDVLLVGPAVQQSGKGGTFTIPTVNITPPGGEFGSIPVDAPYFGHEADNPGIFYFNGTPAATVIFGIDILVPQHFGSKKLDLVVSRPNEGQNNGPFIFSTSGTIGAACNAVERSIPAIAFSAGNNTHRSFTTNTRKPDDPANMAAQVVVILVAALAHGANAKEEQLLPPGIGLTVNLPTFGPGIPCKDPPFVLTRLTGGAIMNHISINSATGFPQTSDMQVSFSNVLDDALTLSLGSTPAALNPATNGRANLPGETLTSAQCKTAVSVFSTDYDAPVQFALPVQHLQPVTGKSHL